MLISKVTEKGGGGEGEGMSGVKDLIDPNPEYRTASELFELMSKNSYFVSHDEDSLTTRDLILLYKNIDIGTKLMNSSNRIKVNELVEKRPNQHVETVVYNDQDSDSDLSEILSTEDINNVFMINQERIDFINDKSFENLLCQKIGGIDIKSSALSTDYDKNFLFKDPYIKKQLKNLNMLGSCSEFSNVFSSSLLDYICCKRLEDNYNFYMDNIIRYVQHTIDQLKRISNGDYLTEKVKEKWREVNSTDQDCNTKVLATSTSIPLHVECKKYGNATWDDIVHSEVDVRSLSKILEKKIVVEIPKLICGSYRLYSKRCDDNLIISCQREKDKEKDNESRVDVVLQLQRSPTGEVVSNISSIIVLQTSQALPDLRKAILPLPYKEENQNKWLLEKKEDSDEQINKEIELQNDTEVTVIVDSLNVNFEETEQMMNENLENDESLETNDYPYSENERHVSFEISNQYSSESSVALRDILNKPSFPQNERTYNLITPDELRVTMQRLKVPTSLLEESGEDSSLRTVSKKKSPIRVRVKSPYENKSFLLEEKKRKRLLEIREKREKKKLALSENCKISKHKYWKGAIMPQASSSVTKLSITNKSFYNSIYGQSGVIERKCLKGKGRKGKIHSAIDVTSDRADEIHLESPLTPEKSKKFINRSYYLDDTETEVMFTQLKRNDADDNIQFPCSPTNSAMSAVSNDSNANFNFLTNLMEPPAACVNNEQVGFTENKLNGADESCNILDIIKPEIIEVHYPVPENMLKDFSASPLTEAKKNISSVECRKSIDKLYELMKKFSKPNPRPPKTVAVTEIVNVERYSTIQGSESGTSLKQHISSSNPSCWSSEKKKIPSNNIGKLKYFKKNDPSTVVPKVIVSSKLQTPKVEIEKNKTDRRKTTSPRITPDNPLKAISQLLHEFDNVQKNRHKNEQKVSFAWKKTENPPIDSRNVTRQNYFRRKSRFDQHIMKLNDQDKKISPNVKDKIQRTKPLPPGELARIPHQPIVTEDKVSKKKIADIIDEAKEARGEAVRGPSKLYSRLNSLAQPKRSYVQAHSEEYQNKYGRNIVSNRLQRLAATSPPVTERGLSANSKNRVRKFGDVTSAPSVKHPSTPQLDKHSNSHCSSPTRHNRRHSPVGFNKNGPSPDAIVKYNETIDKMVAVESYVKSHYGRSIDASPSSEVLLAGHKSRVPLIPTDFEMASITSSPAVEEANEIGSQLHRMIDSMLIKAAPLTKLTECDLESKISKSSEIFTNRLSHEPRRDSDYRISVLEDKDLKTAVENIEDDKNKNSKVYINRSVTKFDLNPVSSRIEMEKLENALYNQLSGALQKRLRIKNLTLTPKHSVQQIYLVQSGDAGSLLVKSTVSSIKLNKSNRESLHEFEVMPVLSKTHLDWNFAQIPMQIATVGYAFPEYQKSRGSTSSRVKLFSEVSSSEVHSYSYTDKADEGAQCFKGVHHEGLSDKAAQVDAADEIVSPAGVVSLNHNTLAHNVPVKKEPLKISTDTDSDENNMSEIYKKVQDVNTSIPAEQPSCSKDNGTEPLKIAVDTADCAKANKVVVKKPADVADALSKAKQGKFAEKLNNSPESTMNSGLHSPQEVDYATSLDMLVALLNEIQKITCQNQMVVVNNQDRTNLDFILNDAANIENSTQIRSDIVSMSSLDELRQLESDTSEYSLYNISIDESGDVPSTSINFATDEISGTSIKENNDPAIYKEDEATKVDATQQVEDNNHTVGAEDLEARNDENVNTVTFKPPSVDKEVSANLPEKEFVDTCTNVPSSLTSLTITRSANVTKSIDVINEPSIHSILKLMDYQTINSNNLFNSENINKVIMELPQVHVNPRPVIIRDKTLLNESFSSIRNENKKERRLAVRSDMGKYCVNKIRLDPRLKIKRDILVTMYSILVFTIFAALSFPELIYLE